MSRHGAWRIGLVAVAGLLALAIAAGAWLVHDYRRFAATPLALGTSAQTIEIARGTSLRGIVDQLRAQHFTPAPYLYWRVLATGMGVSNRLHAGEYALAPGTTPRALLDRMASGKVVQHLFTIVDGWSFAELRAALNAAPKLRHLTRGMSDAAIARAVGIESPTPDPEGWFLPESYAYVLGDDDLALLQRAHAAMVRTLDTLWAARAPDLPLKTPYDALIMASLVEKETAQPDERPRIAGVFERRLQIGMRLQTDPAVIYGMGSAYHGNITKRDLETDTPYNTYTHGGLPPTPIAMPGKPAIEAVLHPAAGKSLYFVARGDGTHVFSDTLEEQNRAVAIYQLHHKP